MDEYVIILSKWNKLPMFYSKTFSEAENKLLKFMEKKKVNHAILLQIGGPEENIKKPKGVYSYAMYNGMIFKQKLES